MITDIEVVDITIEDIKELFVSQAAFVRWYLDTRDNIPNTLHMMPTSEYILAEYALDGITGKIRTIQQVRKAMKNWSLRDAKQYVDDIIAAAKHTPN